MIASGFSSSSSRSNADSIPRIPLRPLRAGPGDLMPRFHWFRVVPDRFVYKARPGPDVSFARPSRAEELRDADPDALAGQRHHRRGAVRDELVRIVVDARDRIADLAPRTQALAFGAQVSVDDGLE